MFLVQHFNTFYFMKKIEFLVAIRILGCKSCKRVIIMPVNSSLNTVFGVLCILNSFEKTIV